MWDGTEWEGVDLTPIHALTSTETQITKNLFSIHMEIQSLQGHGEQDMPHPKSSFLFGLANPCYCWTCVSVVFRQQQTIYSSHPPLWVIRIYSLTCLLKWVSLEGHKDVCCYLDDLICVPFSRSFSRGHFGASAPSQSHSHQGAHYNSQQKQRQVWRALSIWVLWTLLLLEGSQSPRAVTHSEECTLVPLGSSTDSGCRPRTTSHTKHMLSMNKANTTLRKAFKATQGTVNWVEYLKGLTGIDILWSVQITGLLWSWIPLTPKIPARKCWLLQQDLLNFPRICLVDAILPPTCHSLGSSHPWGWQPPLYL